MPAKDLECGEKTDGRVAACSKYANTSQLPVYFIKMIY